MEFIITLEPDEDGVWVAECPAIPGCVSQGATQEEAVENIRAANLTVEEFTAALDR